MTINAYDFVHLGLLAVGVEIKGKTKLQKTVYFLGVLTNSVDQLGYRAHYFGPYSQDVANACSRLRSLGFVDQKVCGGGTVGESGFEVARHDFFLTEDGRTVAILKARKYVVLTEALNKAVKKLNDAGEIDYMKMSIAAKIVYMLERKERATEGELVKVAQRFGWKVTEDEVSKAGQYLQKLGLVEVVG